MKENGAPTVLTIPTTNPTITATTTKKGNSGTSPFGKSRYKFWVLAAITLLALWSMLTGTVTLKWSTNLAHLSDELDLQTHDDLDVLEVEEKEKVVRRMWGVYTQSAKTRLPRFWREAFEAAYEALASDVPAVREAAVTEIAKISIRSSNIDPLPLQSSKVSY
ncbi:hypothetical protein Tsubulata_036119 [Turnera subulata]|uniref:Uncharacterized protein n=1 Tax=Turnera subulata TaxID=218843 RepID=A0A9Q0J1D7_9ROSI|nr:hypothetical protein Tsubulata_036119 [Turnera subulata]